jgi:Cys-tRNA synthase (O-phospho-L-seryl-tRNA:Cys-tRNA synthase)
MIPSASVPGNACLNNARFSAVGALINSRRADDQLDKLIVAPLAVLGGFLVMEARSELTFHFGGGTVCSVCAGLFSTPAVTRSSAS